MTTSHSWYRGDKLEHMRARRDRAEAQRVRTTWKSGLGCCRSSSSHDSMHQKNFPETSRRHFFGCRNLSTTCRDFSRRRATYYPLSHALVVRSSTRSLKPQNTRITIGAKV